MEHDPSHHRVLVAEDVPETAERMINALTGLGYRVDHVTDGRECVTMVERFSPDLVVLDLMMPSVHGIDVLREIAAIQGGRTGVIVCSASSFKVDRDQARKLGAFDFLEKPIDEEELADSAKRFFTAFDRGNGAKPAPDLDERTPRRDTGEDAYLPKLDVSSGYIKLWGTRGSVSVPGTAFSRHGGCTSCLEVRCGDELVIIDAGTGIRNLGNELMKGDPRHITLLIGHTHWDHIQGFPFFAPTYNADYDLTIYGASGFGKNLESIFEGQLDRDYFPVEMQDMAASLEFRHLEQNPIKVGDISIYWEYMMHPGATVGFRIEIGGKRIGYITDNEFLKGYLGRPHDITNDDRSLNPYRQILNFISNVDVLIAEAQYTNNEYQTKVEWGHSSLSNACLLAKLAKAKRWIVTHHDPTHDDEFLEEKIVLTRQILRSLDYPIDVTNAYDGMLLLL